MRNYLNHLGSTIALVVGAISFVSGFARPDSLDNTIVGSMIVLGAVAYRSAKKRLLGEVKSTPTRRILEALPILIIILNLFALNDLTGLIKTNPVGFFLVPAWAIFAFLLVAFRSKKSDAPLRADAS